MHVGQVELLSAVIALDYKKQAQRRLKIEVIGMQILKRSAACVTWCRLDQLFNSEIGDSDVPSLSDPRGLNLILRQ